MINDCLMANLGIQALFVPSLGTIKIYVYAYKQTRLSWLTRVRPRRVNIITHIHTHSTP